MELENQLESHNYDLSYENKGSQQYSELTRKVDYQNNSALNQLLEWGKANPDIMMNYVKYPLEGIYRQQTQTKLQSKELPSDIECSRFKEIGKNRYLQQSNPETSKQENQQQLRFEICEFQDEELNFDHQNNVEENKELVFAQNNDDYSLGSEVEDDFDFGGQIEEKNKEKQPLFKKVLSQVFEPNDQTKTEINYTQLPSKPKRVYRKRKSFNLVLDKTNQDNYSQTNIDQIFRDDYFKKELLPKHRKRGMKQKKMSHNELFFANGGISTTSRANEQSKNKKIIGFPIKNKLFDVMSKEEEFQQLQHLKRNEQIDYVDNRIRHYNQLKKIVINTKSKDEAIGEVFKSVIPKNSDRLSVNNEKNINKATTEEQESSADDKKMSLTPELLRMLSRKFQLYNNYEQGKYQPGYKMSLASIANQFQLSTSTVSGFYEQWRSDPNFSKRIINIQKNSHLPSINNQSEPSQNSGLLYNIKAQSSHTENYLTTSQKMLEIRKVFTERFRRLKSKEARLYFLDECHKEMIMGTSRVEEQTQGKEINFSLMSLLGVKGRASWKVVKWSGKKYQQMGDILQLYKNVRNDQQVDLNQMVKNNRSYLILDPVVVREPQKIRRIQHMTNTKVLLYPQFSKHLNPLQFWFSDVKGKMRMSVKSLAELNKILQKFSNTDFGKYLSDSERYMILALQKRDF